MKASDAKRTSAGLTEWLVDRWYRPRFSFLLIPLLPLSWLVGLIAAYRRRQFLKNADQIWRPPAPVVIVGNITVGGTGKTPLVAAIVAQLKNQGWRPGIISRGYGANCAHLPALLPAQADPAIYGDEPVMLSGLTEVPLVIDSDRVCAAQHLLAETDCNIILSDDGMQHYRLWRDLEILVLDSARLLGNRQLIPAGPLREPVSRISSTSFRVCNGQPEVCDQSVANNDFNVMTLIPGALVNLVSGQKTSLTDCLKLGRTVYGVAGIGNPERFFGTLRDLGFDVIERSFADHHAFTTDDLSFPRPYSIIMTAKDAVKCREFASKNCWYLPVSAELSEHFWQSFFDRLKILS